MTLTRNVIFVEIRNEVKNNYVDYAFATLFSSVAVEDDDDNFVQYNYGLHRDRKGNQI